MRVAITGGTGFVGRNLAERLDDAVVVSRRNGVDITDVDALASAFEGCDAVAHCAGINREIGEQTFRRVHVDGTRAVVEAARRAGVQRIVLVSFLRARPDCGSGYHESKWEAEEIVRASGIPHTILKSGMIYGPGDHMIDHVTKAVRTLPFFWTVGYRERTARPVPVEDAVDVLVAALEGRIEEPTIAVMGADEITLGEAIRRIARVAGRRPAFVPVPTWMVRALAQVTEWTMVVPLVAKAQARMLAEGVSEPAPFAPEAPLGIRPSRPFDDARIREALPQGRFTLDDLRITRRLQPARRA
ncbi:NAD(P)H-binding protein [Microbacterium sp.]|uniref:NAD(P)H-binding protein n=1 Tax=Microbacterium sp. TaxID=51671 RepID=UPI00260273D9|nr:NAD(P)H-binding protein [Microbacterium sp.]MCV0334248.1 NAD(P)H-binding protein [Microbacterium sp.]MCV0374224.1 NAD(P)H-binding protein [Microbacterium sp.]MCV0389296.1 NAD(P)H-binding protein [Microbacterium sp.]MCV0418830.1 NAD(P)H-binding protein [Microbacterium sp.]MCV0421136.1 NAD(P)H-binding protein [Microbacterium sp.]